ncbi:MAG: HNH endonuclease, partial [Myxococcales bacterium]
EAMRPRRISYEKARHIARHADEESIGAWIERAERVPCIALRREIQDREETQMCARGEFEVWAPRRVASVIALACSAARRAAGRWISTGECLARIAQHFIDVWEAALAVRGTLHRRVLERDRFLCQVPGCSRAADHAHHIEYRSRGGSDDLMNLTSLCAVHHLQGVHMGRIRVSGPAPDGLRWEVRTPEGWVPMG